MSLVSGADLRNARQTKAGCDGTYAEPRCSGADEMRPIVFLPTNQRVAIGGVSSPASLQPAPAWNLRCETGFLSVGR
jgi:hypothetical protein